ncbi:MAG: 50S ribosomal protein L10 [Verrucomicrobiales bacterium]|nr:50S ribosomal protein L10 [Verrucomicrobiales bacterium]|tara:strand:- start:33362 stop:33877 length:516 start_codon:yes stop_codon:yes gene_type:complete
MREEKKFLTSEYVARLNASPYFIVADYTGMTVAEFNELRNRLMEAGAEVHVVKNTIFKIACTEAGIAELNGALAGQLAVVTGETEMAGAAKVVKNFAREFERPEVRFGYLGEERLEADDVKRLADLPSLDVLRAQLCGVIQAPATQLARLIQTPASMVARALQARVDKEQG